MAISVSSDLNVVLPSLYLALNVLHDPHRQALLDALAMPSPVDKCAYGVEALYAAVHQDTALTGAALIQIATACKQVGYPITYNEWHGKAVRCAEMGVAMEAVVSGTAPSALTGAPELDSKFAPPVVITTAPPSASPTA